MVDNIGEEVVDTSQVAFPVTRPVAVVQLLSFVVLGVAESFRPLVQFWIEAPPPPHHSYHISITKGF